MKRYEGLFILNTAGREDSIKELIDKISAEIVAGGGKIETVQKMDKKPFVRVTDKKVPAGFYVNIIFEGKPSLLGQLRHKFENNEEIYRVLYTIAPALKEVIPAA